MFHIFRKAFAFIVGLFTVATVSNALQATPRTYGTVQDFHVHAFRRWNGSHGSTRTRLAHRAKLRA